MFSTSTGRGTCSHHGGVDHILSPAESSGAAAAPSSPSSSPSQSAPDRDTTSFDTTAPAPTAVPPGRYRDPATGLMLPLGTYYDTATGTIKRGKRPKKIVHATPTPTAAKLQTLESTPAPKPVSTPRRAPTPRPKPKRAASDPFTGKCTLATAGGAIFVAHDGKTTIVRLYGVDSPEAGQPFAEAARQRLSDYVQGKTVTVYPKGEDATGQLTGWVFVGGDCVNRELVRIGWTAWDRKAAPDEVKLAAVEAKAKAGHLGIWAKTTAPVTTAVRRPVPATIDDNNGDEPATTPSPLWGLLLVPVVGGGVVAFRRRTL